MLIHVVVLYQRRPHRLHKPPLVCPKKALCMRYCLFTFCPYSIKCTESTWKRVTTLVEKNVLFKILLHANIQARKAAHGRNYFSRHNNFVSVAPSFPLSHLPIFDQINSNVLFRRVNHLYLATVMRPIVCSYPVSTWMAGVGFQNAVWDLLK